MLHQFYAQPLARVVAEIIVLPIIWSLLIFVFRQRARRVIGALTLVLVFCCILYITLFQRNGGRAELVLTPFMSFVFAEKQPEYYRSMLMNVVLFVPFGMSLPFVFSNRIKQRVLISVLIGAIVSICIEASQYVFSLGWCETDDVIMNTLGTLIGSASYPLSLLWSRLIKKIKKGKKSDE